MSWREQFEARQRAYSETLPGRKKRAFEVFDGLAEFDEQIVQRRHEPQEPQFPNAMCRREAGLDVPRGSVVVPFRPRK